MFHKQQGIVLISALFITLLVTVLSSTIVFKTLANKKVNHNRQDSDAAYFAAESALNAASQQLRNGVTFLENTAITNWWETESSWLSTEVVDVSDFRKSNNDKILLAADPKYRVEYLTTVNPSNEAELGGNAGTGIVYYRVTAQGQGRAQGRSQLQAIFAYGGQ